MPKMACKLDTSDMNPQWWKSELPTQQFDLWGPCCPLGNFLGHQKHFWSQKTVCKASNPWRPFLKSSLFILAPKSAKSDIQRSKIDPKCIPKGMLFRKICSKFNFSGRKRNGLDTAIRTFGPDGANHLLFWKTSPSNGTFTFKQCLHVYDFN